MQTMSKGQDQEAAQLELPTLYSMHSAKKEAMFLDKMHNSK